MNAKFISIDSKIYNCLIPCTKEDIFSEAEEKIYRNIHNLNIHTIIFILAEKRY